MALGNDTSSQLAIATATAKSMGVNTSYVSYIGCTTGIASAGRRRLTQSRMHLLGGTTNTAQSVSANTKISVPIAQSSATASEAQSLYTSLKSQLSAALSSGNFTRTLKVASVALGAKVTAKVNVTSLGATSALVVVFPPTNAPTIQPTFTSAPLSTESASSTSIPVIVGVSVGGFILLVIIVVAAMYGYRYYMRSKVRISSTQKPSSPTVSSMKSSQVKPIQTGDIENAKADLVRPFDDTEMVEAHQTVSLSTITTTTTTTTTTTITATYY